MALKRLPRRLQHGEEATLVEHLGELRSRLLISLLTLAPAFAVAFAFQDDIVEWLSKPLPDDKQLVTLGVVEPFTTAVKVSMAVAVAVTLPILLYQLWAFLAPAIEESMQRTVAVFATFSTVLFAGGVAFSYFVVMPRALNFLTNFNDDIFNVQIRASYYFSFVTLTMLATGLAFQMPIFILALVRLRILTAAEAPQQPPAGDRGDARLRDPPPHRRPCLARVGVLPAALPLRVLDLAGVVHGEALEPRERALTLGGRVRVLSADWVLPVEGEPIEEGAIAIEDGRIAAVGTAADLGEGERFPEAVIVPGFVNAHTHLEYAVYAGFGDGLSFGPWISMHMERKQRLDRADMEAIARLGAAECLRSGITTVGDLAFSGASAHACAGLGLRAIVYLEVFGAEAAEALRRFEDNREYVSPALSERVRLGVSPHAPYTCSTEVYAASASLELPVATHLNESGDELDWLLRGEGPWQPLAEMLIEPDGQSGIRRLAAAGLLDDRMVAAHCVKVDDEEIELLSGHGVAVAHCPRSNALLGCGIAPLAELRAAGLRVGIGTDGVSSVPSHDFFEELRTVVALARARDERADTISASDALELATLGGARALGLESEIGSLVPGKRADIAVVSLSGSPYLPWEDPAAAVVYGGAPERVLTTLVDGEARYERGGFEWHELIDEASSARGRMLQNAATSATAISER